MLLSSSPEPPFLLVTWSAKPRATRPRHIKTSNTEDERMLCTSFDISFHPGTCCLISSDLDRAEVLDSKYISFIPQSPSYTLRRTSHVSWLFCYELFRIFYCRYFIWLPISQACFGTGVLYMSWFTDPSENLFSMPSRIKYFSYICAP